MKRSIAYGIVAALALLILGVVGYAQISAVYNPIEKNNVPIDRVSVDQIKAWINTPSFSRWTDMNALREYLAGQGIDMDALREESSNLNNRELLSLQNRKEVIKRYDTGQFRSSDGEALQDIACDINDKELEFELHNVGGNNWFLVDQSFTTGSQLAGRKLLSDALVQAKPIRLFINGFPVNTKLDKYWMGEKLFYPEGSSFAQACRADFVRTGRSVDCRIEPIPVREGILQNSYMLITPTFTERGTFDCN